MTRTDPHRPGEIVPCDYTRVLWYETGTRTFPSVNLNCELVVLHDTSLHEHGFSVHGSGCLGKCPRKQHDGSGRCCWDALVRSGAKLFDHPRFGSEPGKCSVCGAWFVSGEVWKHEPTGEHVHVGHDCADKYGLLADRSEWEQWRREQKDLRAQAIIDRKRAAARDAFLADRPQLKTDLDLGGHRILEDLCRKLLRYGSLSDAQVALAHKLADEVRNPPPPELHAIAPEGRTTFEGTVVGLKEVQGDYGSTTKMTVKVPTPDGVWLVYLTAPDSLFDGDEPLRGAHVRVTATLQRSQTDAHFAFGKRPRGERIAALDQLLAVR